VRGCPAARPMGAAPRVDPMGRTVRSSVRLDSCVRCGRNRTPREAAGPPRRRRRPCGGDRSCTRDRNPRVIRLRGRRALKAAPGDCSLRRAFGGARRLAAALLPLLLGDPDALGTTNFEVLLNELAAVREIPFEI